MGFINTAYETTTVDTTNIDTYKWQLPGMLADFKRDYVLYYTTPTLTEYQTAYANSTANLTALNTSVFTTSNNVQRKTGIINTNLGLLHTAITTEKEKNTRLKGKLSDLNQKYDGSDEMISNYKQLYNIEYLRNWALLLGIIVAGTVVSKVFKGPSIPLPR